MLRERNGTCHPADSAYLRDDCGGELQISDTYRVVLTEVVTMKDIVSRAAE